MIRVGLTGGIAVGKSRVAASLVERGVPVIDADRVARQVVEPGQPAQLQIAESFGEGVLSADGALDRKALGALVMADPAARARLEAITHPAIYQVITTFLDRAEAEGSPIAVVDAALMVETGTFRRYDVVLVVRCSPGTQLRRLMAREGIGEEEARRWLRAQLTPDQKAARVAQAIAEGARLRLAVVENDGPLSALDGELARAWSDAGLGALPPPLSR